MPRPKLVRTDKYPYHVTVRSNNKDWFYLPTLAIWRTFSSLLNQMATDFSLRIHAFVLMSNHFHALVTTPGGNLDQIMEYVLREAAKKINRETGRINHVFGGPYKWSVISSYRYYEHAYRYVCQNPVKAAIVQRVEDYHFSSLSFLHRKIPLEFPISESLFDRQSVMDLALWQKLEFLNTPYKEEEREKVRRALRYAVFSFHRDKSCRQLPPDIPFQLELAMSGNKR